MAVRNVSVLGLYNDKKEILLQHRSKDAKRLPDHWAFFGGGIENGETPEQALARESIEELEYRVMKPQLLYAQKFTFEGSVNTKYVFVERYDPSQTLIQHEGLEMGWWKFSDLDKLLIIDHDRLALSKIQDFLEPIPK